MCVLTCCHASHIDSNDDNELSGPDITDKTFEVSMINSSNINPKIFVPCGHQITDNQCT